MRVNIDGISLYFDVDGCELVPEGRAMVKRPMIIALHGGPGADHSLFKPEFAAVTEFAQVIYLDQRGSGRSDRGEPTQWTWDQWAADVVEFCQALDIKAPALVGTSGGGWVALTAAINHPEQIGALVLDSVMPGPEEERLAIFERLGGPEARAIAGRYFAGEATEEVREAWGRVCLPLYSRRRGGDREQADRLQRVRWNDAVVEHFRQVSAAAFGPWPHLARVTCPTLILAGVHDPVATAGTARLLATSLVNAPVRLEVFAEAGHGIFREAPEAAFAILRDFVQSMRAMWPGAEG